MVIGMLAISLALTPDRIMMRTIGTVNSSTKPAPTRVPLDSRAAWAKSLSLARCSTTVSRQTNTMMPPGR